MKDVSETRNVRFHIFEQDNLPVTRFMHRLATGFFQQLFNFQIANPIDGGFEFINGVCVKESLQIPVERISIEARRITVVITGDSAAADIVWELFLQSLKQLAPDFVPRIVLKTEQTSCAVTLGFPFSSIFDKRFVGFIEGEVADACAIEGRNHLVEFRSLRAVIRYSEEKELNNELVPISPKDFVIEPRADTALTQNRYFTLSPTDSKTHFSLIEKLESVMAPKKAR